MSAWWVNMVSTGLKINSLKTPKNILLGQLCHKRSRLSCWVEATLAWRQFSFSVDSLKEKKSQCFNISINISMFRNANSGNLVSGVIVSHVRFVFCTGWCLLAALLRLEAMPWHDAVFTEDMSSIYACKHAKTIENAVWQTSIFLLILCQPSFIILYGPVCLGSTLRNIKKITWAEHCSKWQANALGISKKTLRVKHIYTAVEVV